MPSDKIQQNLVGSYLKQMREKAGLSQKSLGLLLKPEVTTQFVSNIERGITPLPLTHFKRIAESLGIPAHELIEKMESEYSAKLNQAVTTQTERISRRVPVQEHEFLDNLIACYMKASIDQKKRLQREVATILELSNLHRSS